MPQDTETGPGVLETALAYTSALRMADNALLYKYLAKSIGMKHGIIPSFMAKPWGNVGCYLFRTCWVDDWSTGEASGLQRVSFS